MQIYEEESSTLIQTNTETDKQGELGSKVYSSCRENNNLHRHGNVTYCTMSSRHLANIYRQTSKQEQKPNYYIMSDLYLNRNKRKITQEKNMQHDGIRVTHAGFILRVLKQLYSEEGGLTTSGVS